MERELDEKMNNIMTKRGVVGAICVDKRGLCLSAKGVANPNFGGVLSSLADHARKLEPSGTDSLLVPPPSGTTTTTGNNNGAVTTNVSTNSSSNPLTTSTMSSPVIRLESDQGYCLVQKKGDFTLGIFKKL